MDARHKVEKVVLYQFLHKFIDPTSSIIYSVETKVGIWYAARHLGSRRMHPCVACVDDLQMVARALKLVRTEILHELFATKSTVFQTTVGVHLAFDKKRKLRIFKTNPKLKISLPNRASIF